MTNKTKKATFNLHSSVLADLEKAVTQGAATSKNALVERALVKELEELQRQKRAVEWQAAAKDKLFLNDISEIEQEFEGLGEETASGIDKNVFPD